MEKQSQYVLQMESGERALLAMMEKSLFGGEGALSEEEQLAAREESRKLAVFCLLSGESPAQAQWRLDEHHGVLKAALKHM